MVAPKGGDMSAVHPFSLYRPRFFLVCSLIIWPILLSACVGKTGQPKVIPGEGVAGEHAAALEKENARLNLGVLEKETQIKELKKKYDEAVQEVVRTKAKLHSLESKAEAASTIAEAEIALKALRARVAGQQDNAEVVQAKHLLEMSTREFKKHNYGGALYLASQAKGLVHIGQKRLMGREKIAMVSGEVLFALPLPLEVLAKSNMRQGPGLDFDVLFTLEKGTPLVGHSYKDDWVRVKDEDGRSGWVYQTLVGGR